jgi:hypothetical protein
MKYAKSDLTFLPNEWQTPRECIHEVRKPIWMRGAIELPDIEDITFILENSRLVVVTIKVVRA